jgi:hypothetical protein
MPVIMPGVLLLTAQKWLDLLISTPSWQFGTFYLYVWHP